MRSKGRSSGEGKEDEETSRKVETTCAGSTGQITGIMRRERRHEVGGEVTVLRRGSCESSANCTVINDMAYCLLPISHLPARW